MSDGPVIDLTLQGEHRGVKRSRSKLLDSAVLRSRRDPSSASSSSSSLHTCPQAQRELPRHRPHDGYDYRRPIMSATPHPAEVVDLTASDDEEDSGEGSNYTNQSDSRGRASRPSATLRPARRAPRFPRDIFHVDGVSTGQTHPHIQFHHLPPRSNVDIRRSRQLPPLPDTPPRPREDLRRAGHGPPPNAEVIEINDDGDDDLSIQSQRQLSVIEHAWRHVRHNQSRMNQLMRRLRPLGPAQHFHHMQNFVQPAFDYLSTGFTLGGSDEEPPQPPPPAYEPLPPPPEGFTRSPTEGDVLVCPCCGDELCIEGTEGESDKKGEIWVVKSCGHVYCGNCATGRPRQAARKGKAAAKRKDAAEPFTTCRVEGCGERVTGKAMIQLFL